jgi:hypothetical protein
MGFGYEFGSAGDRLRRLSEAVQIILSMSTREQTTFQGEHYQLHPAVVTTLLERRELAHTFLEQQMTRLATGWRIRVRALVVTRLWEEALRRAPAPPRRG